MYLSAAAEHAHASDRFAREIVAFLAPSDAARSRRLMRHMLGRIVNVTHATNFRIGWYADLAPRGG